MLCEQLPLNIITCITEASRHFHDSGLLEYEREAKLLVGHVVNRSQAELFLHGQDVLTPEQEKTCRTLIEQRCQRIPLHYLLGEREFWSLPFTVSPAVLIPRPETEFLLARLIEKIRETHVEPITVLDLCTGSGVIAVVLSRELRCREIIAVDISADALKVASENIKRHVRDSRIRLVASDLYEKIPERPTFDLIVSNPPYIADGDLCQLEKEVQREPLIALKGGKEGLDIIARIIRQANRFLVSGGWLFLEIGAEQGGAVQALLCKAGYDDIAIVRDWAGRDRVAQARLS
ncbi:MAG: protein-(glutamine-N5) methyltransferase, release factor-specific [Desulfobulbus propionicus]|nr:MAG: protein-(glutamine-N5) methyltransferase, release factor-specific [Desulfobulbus propionicus]